MNMVYINGVELKPTRVENVLIPEDEILFGEIVDSPVPTYTSLITKDGVRRVQQANKHFLTLLQLRDDEIKKEGFKLSPFIHPDDLLRIEAAIQKSIQNLAPFKEEFRVVLKNGSGLNLEVFGSPKKNHNGTILFHLVVIDITERKKIENERLELQEHLTQLTSIGNTGHFAILINPDRTSRFTFANDYFLSFIGMDFAVLKDNATRISQTVHPDDYVKIKGLTSGSIHDFSLAQGQFRVRQKDGTIKWAEFYQKPVQQADRSIMLYGVLIDITERKAMEIQQEVLKNQIVEQEEQYRALAENIEEPVMLVDADSNFVFINEKAAVVYGSTKAKLIGKSAVDNLDASVWGSRSTIVQEVLKKNAVIKSEGTLTVNGEVRTYRRTFTPIVAKDKRLVMMIGIDITNEKQETERLEELAAELEKKVEERTLELREALHKEKEYSELQTHFISTTSHEFRTPMATINLATGFIRRYGDKMDKEKMQEKLKVIDRQVIRMTSLLEDILIIRRSEVGQVRRNLTVLSLSQTLLNVVDELAGLSATHFVKLELIHTTDLVKTDAQLFHLILVNLITNAVKFSPGKSEVIVKLWSDAFGYFLSVQDFGIGIPDDDKERVFKQFERGKNVSTIAGTGLGLAIVKRMVDNLDGTIDFVSEVGKGTTFTVALPFLP
jgi:PAS domain S-box-containing protein